MIIDTCTERKREKHRHTHIDKSQKHDFIIQGTQDIQNIFSIKNVFLSDIS